MPTTFCDIHELVRVLQIEINKKPTKAPLLTDIFPKKAPSTAMVVSSQSEAKVIAKL